MNDLSLNNKSLLKQFFVRPQRIHQLSSHLASTPKKSNTDKISKSTFFDRIARDSVLGALEGIRYGSLTIEENGQIYQFGVKGQEPCATVKILNPQAYRKFAFGGNVGAAEAYILSYWESTDLLSVTRLLAKNIDVLSKIDSRKSISQSWMSKLFHVFNLNSIAGSKRNIGAHYDLGNDFFSTFLDESMMYSSAIFENSNQSLLDASVNKLERICQKLNLNSDDHLIEIGTGWGGMAIYAASHYGCRVTTTTISEEQFAYTQNKVKDLGLENKITVLLKDYRLLEGRYDKLVSIEMIEAVGKEHYQSYFEKCCSLLKENGLMLIQAITIPDQRYQASLKSVDFIQKYIFPGGRLPSNQVISKHLASFTDLQIVDLHDIGQDYAKTIFHWRNQFLNQIETIKQQGFDHYFLRMWEYYLCYCEGGFKERAISTVQYLMAKPQASFCLEGR